MTTSLWASQRSRPARWMLLQQRLRLMSLPHASTMIQTSNATTTLALTGCVRCETDNHRHPHTCGKKRARPQAAEAPARASRRRGQAAETADPGAALAARAGADDVTAGANDSQPSPAIAQDVAGPQDRHDSEAGRNGPVGAAAPPAQGADAVEPSGEEAGSDALELAGARDEPPQGI